MTHNLVKFRGAVYRLVDVTAEQQGGILSAPPLGKESLSKEKQIALLKSNVDEWNQRHHNRDTSFHRGFDPETRGVMQSGRTDLRGASSYKTNLQHQISTAMKRYADEFEAALSQLKGKQTSKVGQISYQYSKALAEDLNLMVHVEYEIFVNLFGAMPEKYYTNYCAICVDSLLPNISEITYIPTECSRVSDQEDNDVGWSQEHTSVTSHQIVKDIEKAVGDINVTPNSAIRFLTALTQYSHAFGLIAAPMIKDKQYEVVEIEIGQTYLLFHYLSRNKVYLQSFIAFTPRSGWGSRVLNLVTELADKFCVTIELVPGERPKLLDYVPEKHKLPTRDYQISKEKRNEFYRRFGFEFFGTHNEMRRKPNCAATKG